MRFAIRFMQNNETLLRVEVDTGKDGDLVPAHKSALDEFRKKFPEITLWDGNVTVGYENA